MRRDEVWTKTKAWGCPFHPKKYPRGTSVKAWGCPEAPLLYWQKSGHLSRHYIFIVSYSMHFSWSVITFAFCFLLFYLLQLMVGSHHVCFGERHALFSLPRTL
jgi:hypothetical protein